MLNQLGLKCTTSFDNIGNKRSELSIETVSIWMFKIPLYDSSIISISKNETNKTSTQI